MKPAQLVRAASAVSSAGRMGYPSRVLASPLLSHIQSSRAASTVAGRESVEGKTAIVTGSARGIGKSIALRLAADGYNVCINDIPVNAKLADEVAQEIRSMGRKSVAAIGDVTKRAEVADVVQTSVKELGPLHAFVANAGISQVKGLLDLEDEEFERMFRVNVFGVHNCYSEAAKQMIAQGECTASSPGKIIGASSIVGFKPFALLSHYSASKWAVRGLTQAYAMELAEHNITVNAYAPGIVGTAMWELIDSELAKKHNKPKGSMLKKYVEELTALGRVSVPEDVAKLVSFLASSDANFVTGQTQLVDGGICFS